MLPYGKLFKPLDLAQGLALSTFQVVLVPTLVGVLSNEFFPGVVRKLRSVLPLVGVAITTLLCASPCAQVASILRHGPPIWDSLLHAGGAVVCMKHKLRCEGEVVGSLLLHSGMLRISQADYCDGCCHLVQREVSWVNKSKA